MNTLVITPGDPEGIGPEVTAKALVVLQKKLKSREIMIFGSAKPFKSFIGKEKKNFKNLVFFEPPARSSPGYQSGWAVEAATQYVLAAPKNRMLVTGPIHKDRLQKAGYSFKGHTDFLAHLSQTKSVTMMLANEIFRVALVTNHCSLQEVAKNITASSLSTTFHHAYGFAHDYLNLKNPKIAVLGLNPHAGEAGLLGSEENKIIIPEIKNFQRRYPKIKITGPHSADSFFATELASKNRHDVIIAMYHDQGLIPVKLSDFSNSLNMSLGLPFIRTSVDHGTAFDIAGKNRADPGSMIYAITKAIEFSDLEKT
jgi:4-hydroxythreonine-4-phosphate dehydrogenase